MISSEAKQIVGQLVAELRKTMSSSDKAYRSLLFAFREAWDNQTAQEQSQKDTQPE